MKKSEYLPYLRTLRRVPDDIILSVATRDLDLGAPNGCICGWVIREAMARFADVDAEKINVDTIGGVGYTPYSQNLYDWLVTRFGGADYDWADIYWGVTGSSAEEIERAFVERVMEAAS